MKLISTLIALCCILPGQAQIKTPRLSPAAKIEQTVGLTTIKVSYSRPQKNDREIFGSLVPYGEIWRTGANENTILTTDKPLIFGEDTLNTGSYSIYTRPGETSWDIIFYATTDNWGTPQSWNEDNVVLEMTADAKPTRETTESFTISIDDVTTKSASLFMHWDKVSVEIPFEVSTDQEVMSGIENTLAGPDANDYYSAAAYYLSENKDMKQALEWIDKSIEMREGKTPFWILRRKAAIHAELKDFKNAVSVMEKAIEGAKEAGYDAYVSGMELELKEWASKK